MGINWAEVYLKPVEWKRFPWCGQSVKSGKVSSKNTMLRDTLTTGRAWTRKATQEMLQLGSRWGV